MADFHRSRRQFLFSASMTASGLTLLGFSKDEKEENISPTEDLMREHGALRRILLIYKEAIRRIEARQDFPPEVLSNSANLVHRFVEDYHEKLEEEQIFPRFRKANTLVDLVDTLYEQHQKGRILTESVIKLSSSIKDPAQKSKIKDALQLFVRMY
jgi:hemerythrin-like domain-containing protein